MPIPAAKIVKTEKLIRRALATSSGTGCGIMTPQPGPATAVNPATISLCSAGE